MSAKARIFVLLKPTPPQLKAQPAIHSSKSVASDAGGTMASGRDDELVIIILARCISGSACNAVLVRKIAK